MSELKHLCLTCKNNYPECLAKEILWGIDIFPNASDGMLMDMVIQCDAFSNTMGWGMNEKPDEIYFRDKFKQLCVKLEVDNGELLYMKDAMPIIKYLFDDGYEAGRADRGCAGSIKLKLCPNCKETERPCACERNICIKCGKPVWNITFTICDDCWNRQEVTDDTK